MATTDKVTLPAEFSFAFPPKPTASALSATPARPVHELLSQYNGVPYTTFVTIEHARRIPLLDFHCERLAAAAHRLFKLTFDLDALSDALLTVCKRVGCARGDRGELQLVVVMPEGHPSAFQVHVHVSQVDGVWENVETVDVETRGGPRSWPWIKDTAWVAERRPLEEAQAEDVAETILVQKDKEGGYCLLEGLVSNVYVLTDKSILITAPPELVLPGSLRECVLAGCAEIGVPVVERPPSLSEYDQFATMFVTNAKRCLHPVRVLRIPDPEVHTNCPSEIALPNRPETLQLMDKLRHTVRQLLARYSANIYPQHNDNDGDNLTPARHA